MSDILKLEEGTINMAIYSTYSDHQLAGLLKSGDHNSYTEIYARYSGLLYLHAYNKLRSREEAKDIIQDLFTVLWESRTQIDFKSSLSGYLYQSVKNRVIKLSAYKKVRTSYLDAIQGVKSSETYTTDHLVRQNQLAAIIEKEIEALPDKMKEVFILSRKAGMSHKEIGKHLGIAEPTVKKHINHALKILRSKLSLLAWITLLIKY